MKDHKDPRGTCDKDSLAWLDRPAHGADATPALETQPDDREDAKARMVAQLRTAALTLTTDQQTLVRMWLSGMDLGAIAQATGRPYRRVCQLWDQVQASLRARLHDDQQLFADQAAVRRAAMALPPVQQRVVNA